MVYFSEIYPQISEDSTDLREEKPAPSVALAPGGSGENEPGGSEALRAPLVLLRRPGGVGHCVLQVESRSWLLPVPELSRLASRKLSPTESSEEPFLNTISQPPENRTVGIASRLIYLSHLQPSWLTSHPSLAIHKWTERLVPPFCLFEARRPLNLDPLD